MDVLIERCAGLDTHHWAMVACRLTADSGKSHWVTTVICNRSPNGLLTTWSLTSSFSAACNHMIRFGNAPTVGVALRLSWCSWQGRGCSKQKSDDSVAARQTPTGLRTNLIRSWLEMGTLEMLRGLGFRCLVNGVLPD